MRLGYLDNLKALAIILVVLVHTAVTYSGVGSWFYIVHRNLSDVSYYFFLFLESFSQAFFMSLLFAIAGYFIPESLAKKGTKKFLAGRLFRLGLPALLFALFLAPICEKLAHSDFSLSDYLHGLITFQFVSWTGPLWFTVALLIFTLIYVACKRWFDVLAAKYAFKITLRNVLVLVLLIGMVAFTIRLVFPIGSSVLNLQFSFFSAYIFMFLLGIFARQTNVFETIDYQQAKKWLKIAFAIGVPWWVLMIYFGIPVQENQRTITPLEGGWNMVAFSYALWESFFCVTFILALIGIFKKAFNSQNAFQRFLSTNSFGVYVFHSPVLIAVSVLLKNFDLSPILEWMLVASIVLPVTFIVVHYIRKIPLMRKVFS
jgi:peptidoglycan/LPS O-acetylase OafA/YrhL